MIAGIILAAVAAPVAYFGVPKLARTDCARRKIEERASNSLGAPVHIESVEFTWGGGLVLHHVRTDGARVGEFEATGTIDQVTLHPRVSKLLSRTPHYTAILHEPKLTLAYAEDRPLPVAHPSAPRVLRARGVAFDKILVEDGSLVCQHPSFNEPIAVDKIQADAGLSSRPESWAIEIRSLAASMNDGGVNAAGRLEVHEGRVQGHIALDARSVELNDFLVQTLRRLDPMIVVMPGSTATGAVDVKLQARTEASSLDQAIHAATGSGEFHLFGANLRNSRIMAVVADSTQRLELNVLRFYESKVAFNLRDGRIVFDQAVSLCSQGAVVMSGWAGLDEKLDVTVKVDRDDVRVIGTLEAPQISNQEK